MDSAILWVSSRRFTAAPRPLRRVEDLVHEALGHGLLTALPRVADQPAQGQSRGPVRLDLDRHLVGRTADPAGLDLDRRLDVVQRALERDDGVGAGGDIIGVQLSSEAGNFATIFGDDARSLRSCVTGQVDALEGSSFSDFKEVDDKELPDTGADTRAALYQGVFTNSDGDTSDIYLYVECRPMIVDGAEVDGRFLIVNAFSGPNSYADELPVWSDVLTSSS